MDTLPAEHICSPDTCNTDVDRWAVPLHVAQKPGYSGPRYSIQSRLACTAPTARYRVLSELTKGVGKSGMRGIEVGEAIPRDRETPLPELSTPEWPLPLAWHRAASKIEGKAETLRRASFKRGGKGFKPGDAVSFRDDVFVLLDRAPIGQYAANQPRLVGPASGRGWWQKNVPDRYLHMGGFSGAAWWLQRLDGTLVELPVREKALERLAYRCTADDCRQRSLERFGGPCPDHADLAQGTAKTTLF